MRLTVHALVAFTQLWGEKSGRTYVWTGARACVCLPSREVDGCQVYLGPASYAAEITTAKCSEVNIMCMPVEVGRVGLQVVYSVYSSLYIWLTHGSKGAPPGLVSNS